MKRLLKLKDICSVGSSNLAQKDLINLTGEYPIFGASGYIQNVDFYHQEKEYVAIIKDGSGVGRVVLLPAKSSVISTMQYIIPNDEVFVNYLYYLLVSLNLSRYANGAAIPHVYFKDYGHEKVSLPSYSMQQEIAEVLDKVRKLIYFQKKRLEELDNLVQSVFYEMFGDPVKNEKRWNLDFLNNHLEIIGGYAFKSKEYCENGIPLIRIGNINTGQFNILNMVFVIEKPELKRYILEPGDLLISMTGTVGKEDYGNVCILDDSYTRYYLNQRNAKLKCRGQLNKWYVYFVLKNSQIKKKLTGISRGVRQANISNRDINSLLIPIPPLSLQTRFAAIVEKIEQQKTLVKKALQESEDLFQRLMQDLFRPEQENGK